MKSYGHLNPAYPSEYPGAGNKGSAKRRKACLIGIPIAIVVVVVVVVASVVATKNNGDDKAIPVGSKAISSICSGAIYKDDCTTTLDGAPNAKTANPKELAIYLIGKVEEALNGSYVSALALNETAPSPAVEVCLEVLEDAVEQLKNAAAGLNSLSAQAVEDELEDIHTWLDASATYHETCLDELLNAINPDYPGTSTTYTPPTDNVTYAGDNVRKLYSILLHLTNFVTSYASKLPDLPINLPDISLPKINFRRLLSEDEGVYSNGPFVVDEQNQPAWVGRHGVSRRLLQLTTAPADAVVGPGAQYSTIKAALDAAPQNSKKLWVIQINEGKYLGQVEVTKKQTNIGFRGAGQGLTTLSAGVSVGGGSTTFKSATLTISGTGFLGTGFTVENIAGPEKHQAVAIRVSADLTAFYKTTFRGYQDTLYCHTFRQFYSQITAEGTVDYIFGNGAVIIQDSQLLAGTGILGQQNTYTAQGRTDPSMNTGIVLHGSTLAPNESYKLKLSSYRSYLGRPWKAYSRTILVDCDLDSIIQPDGWLPWDGDLNLKTLYYAEFKSKGLGGGTAKRVSWSSQITNKKDVGQYLANKFVSAKKWLTATSIPYYATTFTS